MEALQVFNGQISSDDFWQPGHNPELQSTKVILIMLSDCLPDLFEYNASYLVRKPPRVAIDKGPELLSKAEIHHKQEIGGAAEQLKEN